MNDTFRFPVQECLRLSDLYGHWAIWSERFEETIVHFRHALDQSMRTPAASALTTVPGRGGKNIAVIAARGVLLKSASYFGTSTVQLRNDIRQAVSDPNVSGILLRIDSPGGSVAGIDDLASDVRMARRKKPLWSHIEDVGASAAYHVASQSDLIYANSESALVGSIGTIMTVYDQSKFAEQNGIKPLLFRTGPLKGAGTPGAVVTEEDQAYFQRIVDSSQATFDRDVQKGRGLNGTQLAAVRTGEVFPASRASELKLIDGIQSLDKTLSALAAAG